MTVFQTALEQGILYALVALALFVSFRTLNIADMTTDGAFTLGCAVSGTCVLMGHPILALPAALLAGAGAGCITAFLQTRMGVPAILAGIITGTGFYSINLAVMGSSNLNLFGCDTIFSKTQQYLPAPWSKLLTALLVVGLVCILLTLFFRTRLGLSIRATGDNPDMVKASSINPSFTITVGLAMANGLTALSGGLIAQYQKSADINLGVGMVVIGLASLVIGETLLGRGGMGRKIAAVLLGSILYRFMIAAALRLNVPAENLKLISALIVAVAISMPTLREKMQFQRKKRRGKPC